MSSSWSSYPSRRDFSCSLERTFNLARSTLSASLSLKMRFMNSSRLRSPLRSSSALATNTLASSRLMFSPNFLIMAKTLPTESLPFPSSSQRVKIFWKFLRLAYLLRMARRISLTFVISTFPSKVSLLYFSMPTNCVSCVALPC